MASIPPLTSAEFATRLRDAEPELELSAPVLDDLYGYFEELRRWSPRLSLVGAGTATAVPERHFAESLAALPLLDPGARRLLDLGSGAGFPGLALALARRELAAALVEPRQRKRAFLAAVARRVGLRVTLLDARVAPRTLAELPSEIDVITVRALRLAPTLLAGLAARLRPGGCLLLWTGEGEGPAIEGLAAGPRRRLGGSRRRILRAYRREGGR